MRIGILWGALVLLLSACGHDITTPVLQAKLTDPWATLPAAALRQPKSYCQADGTGQYHEQAVQIDDQGHTDGHDFSQGGGCVLRPLEKAWAASRATEAFHWDRSDLDEVKALTDASVAYKFLSQQSAGPSIFRQHWAMEWDHTVVNGTRSEAQGFASDAPQRILIQYQKVQGTSHIRYWAGAVTLDAVTRDVTSVMMRDEIDADQTGAGDSANAIRAFIGKLRTL